MLVRKPMEHNVEKNWDSLKYRPSLYTATVDNTGDSGSSCQLKELLGECLASTEVERVRNTDLEEWFERFSIEAQLWHVERKETLV